MAGQIVGIRGSWRGPKSVHAISRLEPFWLLKMRAAAGRHRRGTRAVASRKFEEEARNPLELAAGRTYAVTRTSSSVQSRAEMASRMLLER